MANTSSPDHHTFPLQLMYLLNNRQGQIVKRLIPVEQLLMYQQLGDHYVLEQRG